MTYVVAVTPIFEEDRRVDPAYEYEVEASAPHTALHRGLMMFREENPSFRHCHDLAAEVRAEWDSE